MNSKDLNQKPRFSNRAESYAKYRPNYPNEIIDFLNNEIGLTKENIIADIGSGTGISAKLFLDNRNEVYGIEPNAEMRAEGEKYLINYKNFHSIDGSSVDTKLESESVDIITSGQAFNWFQPESTKKEFFRILKPNGIVVLFENRRKGTNSQFTSEYMKLAEKYFEKDCSTLPLNTDYSDFFDLKTIHQKVFSNPQVFNLERLKGELVSYSFMPNEENPRFNDMISEFELLFEKYSDNGIMTFEYETVLYYCKMK